MSLSDSGNTISFTYDAAGNRISKTAHGITTWYVRDAQGNVMSVYTQGNNAIHGDSLTQTEADVYGSSRLGLLNLSLNCGSLALPDSGSLVRGSKLFELTNHLGNVLETISDKKIQHTSDNSTVDYYVADVINANDFYSFGMQMPGRAYSAGSAGSYRYGFNGQEKLDDISGAGNHMAAEFWEYDGRIGRRWNLDPNPSPGLSQYAAFNNNPLYFTDPLGDTSVVGAGGDKLVTVEQSKLEFYDPSKTYYIHGTHVKVPVEGNQLRSFSNVFGTFSARWVVGQDGNVSFAGYKNDNNQTLEDAVNSLKEYVSSFSFKLSVWASSTFNDALKHPEETDRKTVEAMLLTSLLSYAEPTPSSASSDYSSIVQGVESIDSKSFVVIQTAEDLGATAASTTSTTTLAEYWPKNEGALGEWQNEFLMPGQEIDRFGSGFGRYFSPRGTPMEMRALPFGNTGGYNAFQVVKPFQVQSSTIGQAFGKIGLGKQYLTPVNMNTLLKRGIIAPIK
jgi:hypothetical protein